MNKLLLSLAVLLLAAACSSSDHGELVGVQDRQEWFPSEPYGMVYIPQGSTIWAMPIRTFPTRSQHRPRLFRTFLLHGPNRDHQQRVQTICPMGP